nr:uncharacterized protein LOC104086155 [Nicotiana tomentosiformis]
MRLTKFIKSPSYMEICYTLCGVDSNAKWTRKQGDIHLHMVHSDFNKTAKVWLNFVQAGLMLVEYNSDCTRVRVCVIFFLMTGRPINVGEIMLGEMARTRFGRHIRRFFFGNLLTQYMLFREVPEYLGYDKVVEAPKGLLDITSLLEPISKLTQAARNERDENFNSSSKKMLGIAPGSPVHSSEDANTVKGSDTEDYIGDDVTGPLALMPLGPDDDVPRIVDEGHAEEEDSDLQGVFLSPYSILHFYMHRGLCIS